MNRPNLQVGEQYRTKQACLKTMSIFGWNQNMYYELGKLMTISKVDYSARKGSYYIRFRESSWSWHPDDLVPPIVGPDMKVKIKPVLFDETEIIGK